MNRGFVPIKKIAKSIYGVNTCAILESSTTQPENKMKATYIIKKTYVGTATGGEKAAWDVVDATDGYVYDTFSLKRDAKVWIERAMAAA